MSLIPISSTPRISRQIVDQRALALCARGDELARLVGALEVRLGQRVDVDLAVGGPRQLVERHPRSRDHVVRQVLGDERPQLLRPRRLTRIGRDEVGDQAWRAALVLAVGDGRGADAWMTLEHGLDLTGLDAEAADLELAVAAPEEVDRPSGSQRARSPVR